MKKIIKVMSAAAVALALSSCSMLQNTLSSVQNEKLTEETGIAVYGNSVWTYCGLASDNMAQAVKDGVNHSFRIDFGKQVALKKLSGSVTVNYTDEDGLGATKTFTSLKGKFSDDFKSYFLDMNEIMSLFDGKKIPSGTAVMEMKVQGFVCAEGSQNGRTIPAFTAKLPVRPLYSKNYVDFSTCWYKDGDKVELPLNGSIDLQKTEVISDVTGTYSFKPAFNAETNMLELTPQTNLKGLSASDISLVIQGIVPDGSGETYDKEISVNLIQNAIVIDGRKDSNYSSENALVVKDQTGDQEAFGYTTMGEITEVSLVNDDNNLYIGVSGDLVLNWNDSLIIMLSNGTKAGTSSVSDSVKPADTFTTVTKNGRPNVYIFHKPGSGNTGTGAWGAYSEGVDITSSLKLGPEGWTDTTNGDFLEYSIPLTSIGFAKGDTVKVAVAMSLKWDEGNIVCDVVPDAVVTSKTYDAENKTGSVRMDFAEAISYEIK